MEAFSILLQLGGIFALVFLNGFFVAAEFAIVKVRSTQIEPLAARGSKRARIAQDVIGHLDAYLSATQLGITLTSLGLGWMGEPFVAHMLEPLLASLGVSNPTIISTLSFALGFGIITFLHIVLGELAPKSLAIQRAQGVTLAIASPLHLFFVVFRPFIWMLNGTANFFLRMIGIPPASETEIAHSEEELRLLLSKGTTITSTGKSISLRAMELRDRTVREVMVPRTGLVSLSTMRTIEDNIAIALENQFTRYPLCERDVDNIVGMIHLKDLFKLKGETGPGGRLLDIKREMLFVPETMSLERTLNLFLAKRMLMAIAVDEYGGTAGLVTLENVLEELVGEIRDEFDVESILVHKVSDTEFVVDGAMPLLDFSSMFTVIPDSRDVVTVSGYVIHLIGTVPVRGAEVRIGDWQATIEAVDGIKVKTVRMKKRLQEKDLA
ncbi:MAG: HlyC/CorC family transporter [Ignavibacteriae bacterium]|nr:HlyC/CorC family transporter [Ignavibacteriota bacterium]